MSNTFEPMTVPGGRAVNADLRYQVLETKYGQRLKLFVPARLYKQVKPQPKGWRLDVAKAAGRARLSALIQLDGQGCKKHEPRDDDKSISFSWSWQLDLPGYFPESKMEVTTLTGVAVTSMGIEFDLPKTSVKKKA